jgi:catechol 2,3-dioxygenase-like lactoylglutathione lyase family enzyme
MPINGVETVAFGVKDVEQLGRYFDDFGLQSPHRNARGADFTLPEGSKILVRYSDDQDLPPPSLPGEGPREVIWGVDSVQTLDGIEAGLRRDRAVSRDSTDTLHTTDPNGIAIGFRVFHRIEPQGNSPVENSVSNPKRWNMHRPWYDRAYPKAIQHVVFTVPDIDSAVAFYVERLNFRVSDIARQRGIFLRAEGRNEHHNLFFAHKDKGFHHIAFSVDSVDELMAGANYMQRKGWPAGAGLGRHRIASTLYYYFKAPTGGEIEYAADTDWLDDSWVPRIWEPRYGNEHWVGTVNAARMEPPHPGVTLLNGPIPKFGAPQHDQR